MLAGASWRRGSRAGKSTHFSSTHLSARLALVFRSSELVSSMYTVSSLGNTLASASALAWSGLWRPIWPRDHAAADLMWSSGSVTSALASGGTPLDRMVASAH